jgi:hypothetical protein
VGACQYRPASVVRLGGTLWYVPPACTGACACPLLAPDPAAAWPGMACENHVGFTVLLKDDERVSPDHATVMSALVVGHRRARGRRTRLSVDAVGEDAHWKSVFLGPPSEGRHLYIQHISRRLTARRRLRVVGLL